jgi:hypothetical protein
MAYNGIQVCYSFSNRSKARLCHVKYETQARYHVRISGLKEISVLEVGSGFIKTMVNCIAKLNPAAIVTY